MQVLWIDGKVATDVAIATLRQWCLGKEGSRTVLDILPPSKGDVTQDAHRQKNNTSVYRKAPFAAKRKVPPSLLPVTSTFSIITAPPASAPASTPAANLVRQHWLSLRGEARADEERQLLRRQQIRVPRSLQREGHGASEGGVIHGCHAVCFAVYVAVCCKMLH